MAVQAYESDYLSAQIDPVPGYLAFQASRRPTIKTVSGTIYDKLDSNFSIFKTILNRTIYAQLLNDPEARLTVLVFPDSLVPAKLKDTFYNLDYGDATSLIQSHIIEDIKIAPQLTSASMLIPTKHPLIRIQTKQNTARIHPWGTSSAQMISLLNKGDMFINGIVIVIDQPIIP